MITFVKKFSTSDAFCYPIEFVTQTATLPILMGNKRRVVRFSDISQTALNLRKQFSGSVHGILLKVSLICNATIKKAMEMVEKLLKWQKTKYLYGTWSDQHN